MQWKVKRIDEGEEPDPREADCALEIEGRIECGGTQAGLLYAHYIYAENTASDETLMWLWDLDGHDWEDGKINLDDIDIDDKDLPDWAK
jgi:hypothetical protein